MRYKVDMGEFRVSLVPRPSWGGREAEALLEGLGTRLIQGMTAAIIIMII